MLKEVIQDSWEEKIEKDEVNSWFISLKGKRDSTFVSQFKYHRLKEVKILLKKGFCLQVSLAVFSSMFFPIMTGYRHLNLLILLLKLEDAK